MFLCGLHVHDLHKAVEFHIIESAISLMLSMGSVMQNFTSSACICDKPHGFCSILQDIFCISAHTNTRIEVVAIEEAHEPFKLVVDQSK